MLGSVEDGRTGSATIGGLIYAANNDRRERFSNVFFFFLASRSRARAKIFEFRLSSICANATVEPVRPGFRAPNPFREPPRFHTE